MSDAATGAKPENSTNRMNSIVNGKNLTNGNEEPNGQVAEPPLININKGLLKHTNKLLK